MKFKTLVFKEGTKYQEFIHIDHQSGERYTSDIPELRPIGLTMDLVKIYLINLNLKDVTLVTVEVNIIEN